MINIDYAQINQDKWSEPKYEEIDSGTNSNKNNEQGTNIEPLNKSEKFNKKSNISKKEEIESSESISKSIEEEKWIKTKEEKKTLLTNFSARFSKFSRLN